MSRERRGAIAWMASHKVAANILMAIFLIGGFFFALEIKKEVFPDTDLDSVSIYVSYPGATPFEIEESAILPIESAILDIEGIKKSSISINEGSARVNLELENRVDRVKAFQDISQAINSISSFPQEMERPEVSLLARSRNVVDVTIYGDVREDVLSAYASNLYDRFVSNDLISKVEIDGQKSKEIAITLNISDLKRENLTLQEIANRIKLENILRSGGNIRGQNEEILILYDSKMRYAQEILDTQIALSENSTPLRLRDIARVSESFEEKSEEYSYNNKRAINLDIYRSGDRSPIEVSDATKKVIEEFRAELPDSISIEINHDRADVYRDRLSLLLKNGFIGLLLVFIILGAFLEFRLAFWVVVGIPTAFLGSFLFLPFFDVSVNMVSMFAFILALGIVVDDAIIAGENIYEHRLRGESFLEASIEGAKDIATPLSFAIITNIVAFMPLLFIPGMIGKMFYSIPVVIATVFIISWIEVLFIMPNHLAYSKKEHNGKISKFLFSNQQKIAKYLDIFTQKIYKPSLVFAIKNRYIVISIGIFVLIVALAYAKSGRMGFTLMPIVESDRAVAYASLPIGSSFEDAKRVEKILIEAGKKVVDSVDSELSKGFRSRVVENSVRIDFYLYDFDSREISTLEFNKRWRKFSGEISGVESLRFRSDIGGPGGGGSALNIMLLHNDVEILKRASSALTQKLSNIRNLTDIEDSFSSGKRELKVELNEYGKSLGFDSNYISNNIRASFFGAVVERFQRGKDEVTIKLYLDKKDRDSIADLYLLDIKSPTGGYVPLRSIANIYDSYSYSKIEREDGRRVVQVEASVEPIRELPMVVNKLDSEILEELKSEFLGLEIKYGGRMADTNESMGMLMKSFLMVLLLIFIALAIPFGSYSQPLIVMIAIPFGIIGALIGHLIMDYGLSIISVMGIVALSGVVVNDTLILIDYANKKREQGLSAFDSIIAAGVRRFRPIILTTVTTFGGLAPMIFESSIQARFMIPMAISLGYGILFATLITLILIPSLYLVLEDLKFKK